MILCLTASNRGNDARALSASLLPEEPAPVLSCVGDNGCVGYLLETS
jgi:hypothetical protein